MDKTKLDKFYTKPEWAKHCTQIAFSLITPAQRKVIIEPSAGAGSFVDAIPLLSRPRVFPVDIAPERNDIFRQDFFEFSLNTFPDHTMVIGNPPFGFAANLAVKFFNQAATMANVIAFIVPLTFRKKSVQNRLHAHFHLIYDEPCPKNSFTLEGAEYDVPSCFQIWIRTTETRNTKPEANPGIKWMKKKEAIHTSGALAIRRVGSNTGKIIEGDLHTLSESTHYFFTASAELCDMIREANLMNCPAVENTVAAKSLSKQEIYGILNNVESMGYSRSSPDVLRYPEDL